MNQLSTSLKMKTEIIEEDVPIQEEDQPQRITPEPEDYPEATAPMEELTESPTPQTPEQMETQTPRVKRNIDDVMHSPTKENTTKKTRINLNINLKNRLLLYKLTKNNHVPKLLTHESRKYN